MALDAVTVVCELDGARYSVPAAKARRSNLIQSLSSEINSLVEGISVPFSAGDVGPWLAFDVSDPCNTILTCVSTLKVLPPMLTIPQIQCKAVYNSLLTHPD